MGRTLRPSPGKAEAIIIDLVGNTAAHGLPEQDRHWSLERGLFHKAETPVRCPHCLTVSLPGTMRCRCGHRIDVRKVAARDFRVRDLSDREILSVDRLDWLVARADCEADLRRIAALRDYHPRWVGHVMAERPDLERRARG